MNNDRTPNPMLVEDAMRMAAATDALASVLDLIEDEMLREQIADGCAGYCAAFMIGAAHALEHDFRNGYLSDSGVVVDRIVMHTDN